MQVGVLWGQLLGPPFLHGLDCIAFVIIAPVCYVRQLNEGHQVITGVQLTLLSHQSDDAVLDNYLDALLLCQHLGPGQVLVGELYQWLPGQLQFKCSFTKERDLLVLQKERYYYYYYY